MGLEFMGCGSRLQGVGFGFVARRTALGNPGLITPPIVGFIVEP